MATTKQIAPAKNKNTKSSVDKEILSRVYSSRKGYTLDKIARELKPEEVPIFRQAIIHSDSIFKTKGLAAREAFIEGVLRTIRAFSELGN